MHESEDQIAAVTDLQAGKVDPRPVEFDLYVGPVLFLTTVHSIVVRLPLANTLSLQAHTGAYFLLHLTAAIGVMRGSRLAFCAVVLLWVSASVTPVSYDDFMATQGWTEIQRLIWYFSGLVNAVGAIYCAGRLANAFRENPKA